MTTLTFPPGFRWGVATAAAQIEGAAFEDGKGASIWDTFCRRPGTIADSSTIDVACDHYHRMEADVALLKELGYPTYRFSVSWARVMPDGRHVNEAGLDFYERLVDCLRQAGIEPWLTLYHWDLPQPLQDEGGWTVRTTSEAFAAYARAVYERLGSKVKVWTTLNEPWCSSFLSYAAGEHAPGLTSPALAVAAVHHLMLGHGLAVRTLREAAAQAGHNPQIGITLNFSPVHPADPASAADLDAARRVDGTQNRVFLEAMVRGAYPADVVEDMSPWADIRQWVLEGDMEAIAEPIDVLGVNFYNGQTVAAPAPGTPVGGPSAQAGQVPPSTNVGSENVRHVPQDLPVTDMGWQVDPADLHELLVRLEREYTGTAGPEGTGIPIVITENGAAYADQPDAEGYVEDTDRLAYIRDHLAAVHAAIADGARVEGYLVWSLMDNFEWAFGYTKRFGIVRVDYETQRRVPKASARWFSQVVRVNSVTLN
ncbi:MAG: GH1 family beta-glucosidase [Actinomyces urogenitalis]|uniref:GH1 family beta-glucosidase n=1 Tax=Actinomyces urogenitalis TaxID=103621 RepID=UPI002A8244BD|nr:GH1 family beta-glucosidase [Actinomyces urogenitalis]MDY3677824.1 GH1 family beta-glucosidase [Actinomyces urogenitalis]